MVFLSVFFLPCERRSRHRKNTFCPRLGTGLFGGPYEKYPIRIPKTASILKKTYPANNPAPFGCHQALPVPLQALLFQEFQGGARPLVALALQPGAAGARAWSNRSTRPGSSSTSLQLVVGKPKQVGNPPVHFGPWLVVLLLFQQAFPALLPSPPDRCGSRILFPEGCSLPRSRPRAAGCTPKNSLDAWLPKALEGLGLLQAGNSR